MGKATAEHAGRYVADGGHADLRRLVTVSEVTVEAARRAFSLVTLRAAQTGQYEWVSAPFFLALALRKPAAA